MDPKTTIKVLLSLSPLGIQTEFLLYLCAAISVDISSYHHFWVKNTISFISYFIFSSSHFKRKTWGNCGGSKERALGTHPHLCSISFSCSFQQKTCQIIGFHSRYRGWRPYPRLENSGSTTEIWKRSRILPQASCPVSMVVWLAGHMIQESFPGNGL